MTIIGSYYLLGVVFSLLVVLFLDYMLERGRRRKAEDQIKYYNEKYLKKSGWWSGFGDFELHSIDGGKHWFAVGFKAGNCGEILGDAEVVYPGLVKKLEALEKLRTITALTSAFQRDGLTEEKVGLLKEMGFEVVKPKEA